MAGKITLMIVKPVAFRKNYLGQILCRITQAGFRVSAIKSIQMTIDSARDFYKVHENKPFFDDLVEFMASGPVVVALLEKENSVEDFRKLLGNTNPSDAEEGTLRNIFGTSIRANALHGSDSDENAKKEAAFFFREDERF